MEGHIRIKNKALKSEYHVLVTIYFHPSSHQSLAQWVNYNPRGIDWPIGYMVMGDSMGKNIEVTSGAFTIYIENDKGKKSHVSEVSSSYFYTRREVD